MLKPRYSNVVQVQNFDPKFIKNMPTLYLKDIFRDLILCEKEKLKLISKPIFNDYCSFSGII